MNNDKPKTLTAAISLEDLETVAESVRLGEIHHGDGSYFTEGEMEVLRCAITSITCEYLHELLTGAKEADSRLEILKHMKGLPQETPDGFRDAVEYTGPRTVNSYFIKGGPQA